MVLSRWRVGGRRVLAIGLTPEDFELLLGGGQVLPDVRDEAGNVPDQVLLVGGRTRLLAAGAVAREMLVQLGSERVGEAR